jgi:hypothetical protein
MNIKILSQNIVNNPSDFTAEQIEKYFEDYAELRLSAVSDSKNEQELFNKIRDIISGEVFLRDVPYSFNEGEQEKDPDSVDDAAKEIVKMLKKEGLV